MDASEPSTPRRVILVGQMGSGKSTVGRRLAAALRREAGERWRVWDLDRAIEEEAGRTIAEIFAVDGEATFRGLEARALATALERDALVLSCGGGTPCQPGAMDSIVAAGVAVWLDASPYALAVRIAGDSRRPLVADLSVEETAALLEAQRQERAPFYSRSPIIVDAMRPIERTVRTILKSLPASLVAGPAPEAP